MSKFSKFLKENKKLRVNTTFPATKALTEEDGSPVLWTVRPISTEENDKIRDACTTEVPITGKPGMYRQKFNNAAYMAKIVVAGTVEPDLNDKELQDSYGVMGAEALAKTILDNPGEYNAYAEFIVKYNGFDDTFQNKVNEAKNS